MEEQKTSHYIDSTLSMPSSQLTSETPPRYWFQLSPRLPSTRPMASTNAPKSDLYDEIPVKQLYPDYRFQQKLEKLLFEKYKKIGWCKDHKGYLYIKKKDAVTYAKFVEELTPEAHRLLEEEYKQREISELKAEEDEKSRLANQIKPDALLVIEDVIQIDSIDTMWDSEHTIQLVQKALDELNIEIIKRIVRQAYPHKF